VQALVQLAVDEFGRLDAAFDNATDGPLPAPLADIDVDEFDLGIRVNVRGTFLGMKYQVPAMLAPGGGAIVNMASIAGLRGTAGLSAYTTGKAGIIGLTQVATTPTRASGSTSSPPARSSRTTCAGRVTRRAHGRPVGPHAPGRHDRRGRRRRAAAVLRPGVVRHRRDAADPRRPARRRHRHATP
jgi:hypothetical protein